MSAVSSQTFDVVIAGGGIVGSACALACAKAGLNVALVEGKSLASGATGAAMGHIVVMNDSAAQFELTRHSQRLWRGLIDSLPKNVEYETPGTLWIAADDDELAEAASKQVWLAERGVPCRMLSGSELADLEPNLRAGFAGALLVSEDATVNPSAAAVHFAKQAESLGVSLIVGRAIKRLGHGEALLDDGSILSASKLVNALGAQAVSLTASLPIRKRKGHLAVAKAEPGFARHQLVELGYLKSAHGVDEDSVAFNVQPRPGGKILVGSSRQYGNEDAAIDQSIMTAMLERAAQYMPAISSLAIERAWTGFRAATPDKLPLIGPHASDPTLWLATGHEGLGITTSLATAELIASHLTDGPHAIPPEPYLPARFGAAAIIESALEERL